LNGKSAGDALQEFSAKIGEKLELRRAVTLEGDNVAVYLHHRSADLPPSVGVLVAYTGEGEQAEAAARQTAMQIAALRASYLTRDAVPAEVIEKERSIAEQITREEGKPEQAIPKIVEGRLNGFYKENVLLEQASVADSKKTVKALLAEAGATASALARFEFGKS